MTPVAKRITAAFGAGAFGQVSNTLIQLFSLPIFLTVWDTKTYGLWIIYSAIPGYLSMADIGMVQAAGNRMTMEVGRGNLEYANRIFQSTLAFMLIACISIALIIYMALAITPESTLITDGKIALALLLTGVLAAMFGGLAEAVLKACDRYAYGTMIGNIIRFAEWGGWIAGLVLYGTYTSVAAGGLITRLAGTSALIFIARRSTSEITWGLKSANKLEIINTIKPALSFMAFPLSNAFSLQGVTLLTGYICGASQVVIFNAYRTLARSAIQVTGVFSNALWAEFSKQFGLGGTNAIKRLYTKSAAIGALASICLSVTLLALAPWLLELWTHGRVPLDTYSISILLAYAAIGGGWHVPRVLLMATNQHVDLSKWSICSAISLFILAYILGSQLGIAGFGLAMLLSEAFIATICINLAKTFIQSEAR